MKICKICGIEKQLDEFHFQSKNKDGRHTICIICRREIQKEYRIKYRDSINESRRNKLNNKNERDKCNEYHREYYRLNKEKFNLLQKLYRQEHPERCLASSKKYALKNPHIRKKISEKYAKNNPEKRRAKGTLNKAVSSGRIIKQPCTVCGSLNVHAHHSDYSKPLEVIWLCPKHHKEIHQK